MSAIHFESTYDDSKLRSGITRTNQTVRQWSDNIQREGLVVEKTFRRVAEVAGAYLSLRFAQQVGRDIIQVRGEFQQLNIALETMLGSKAKADQMMAGIVEQALKSPFTVREIADQTKQIIAMGVAVEDASSTIKMLGDVAAGTSVPLSRLAINYGQVISLGKLQSREARDFAMAGVNIIGELADMYGKARNEVEAMMEASQISSNDVVKAFQRMSGEGGKFYNLMEKQNASVTGQISNLRDKLDLLFDDIGRANEGFIYGSIEGLGSLVAHYDDVIDILKVLIATYGAYKTATIVHSLLEEVAAAGSLTGALKQTAIAQVALNVAQKASPVGLAFAGISALVGGYALWAKHAKNTNTFTEELNKSITDEVLKLDSLFRKIKMTEQGTKERADAIKLANDRYGDYLQNLLSEKSSLEDIETAQKNATNALIANIAVQKNKEKLSEVIGGISDKFDKEFGDFVTKYGEVFGTDRIPEFVQAINAAIDEKIKAGGGQVERGLLEYSSIAKRVYDDFIKEISQKTGYLQYDFKEFQDAFLDFASYKAEKSGFVEQLQAMIASYDQMLEQIKKPGTGSTSTEKESDIDEYRKLLQQKEKDYLSYNAALRQYGKEWAEANYQLLLKDGLSFEKYLENQVAKFKDSRANMIAIAEMAQKSGFTLFQPELKTIKSKSTGDLSNKNPLLDTKQLQNLEGWYKKIEDRLKKLYKEQDTEKLQKFGKGLSETSYILNDISSRLGDIDEDLASTISDIATAAKDAGNLVSGIATGNVFQIISGGVGLLIDGYKALFNENQDLLAEYQQIHDSISEIVQSISVANEALSNTGSNIGVLKTLALIQSSITGLLNDAKRLNEALPGSNESYGRTTGESGTNSFRTANYELVREQMKLVEAEIDKLAAKLLSGNISDEQRKAIEEILASYNELINQMDVLTQNLIGTTINDLGNSIVSAFLEGEDAVEAWGNKVDQIVKKVLIDQLTVKLLKGPLEAATDQLITDMDNGLTPEEMLKFSNTVVDAINAATPAMDAVKKAFEAAGFTFDDSSSGGYSELTGIQSSLTEETGSILAGIGTSIHGYIKQNEENTSQGTDYLMQSLAVQQEIAENTSHNKNLGPMYEELQGIKKTLEDKL